MAPVTNTVQEPWFAHFFPAWLEVTPAPSASSPSSSWLPAATVLSNSLPHRAGGFDDSEGELVDDCMSEDVSVGDLGDVPLATPDVLPSQAPSPAPIAFGDQAAALAAKKEAQKSIGYIERSRAADLRKERNARLKKTRRCHSDALASRWASLASTSVTKGGRPKAAKRTAGNAEKYILDFAYNLCASHSGLFAIGGFVSCRICGLTSGGERKTGLSTKCRQSCPPGGGTAMRALLKGKLPSHSAAWPDGEGDSKRSPLRFRLMQR